MDHSFGIAFWNWSDGIAEVFELFMSEVVCVCEVAILTYVFDRGIFWVDLEICSNRRGIISWIMVFVASS
jgi:hypothetical protein